MKLGGEVLLLGLSGWVLSSTFVPFSSMLGLRREEPANRRSSQFFLWAKMALQWNKKLWLNVSNSFLLLL